jgi:hypothetical protein
MVFLGGGTAVMLFWLREDSVVFLVVFVSRVEYMVFFSLECAPILAAA